MGKLSQIKTVKLPVLIIALLSFILSGCAANNRNMSDVAKQLRHNLPVETAVTKLEAMKVESQSVAQYALNLGYLQLVNGDYQNALVNFEKAKQTMASLQAISISENLGSATVNETFRSYSGWPTDQVLVHGMMAMAYLLNNDLNGARVEILQADVRMNKLAESDKDKGQLAFVRYLAGVVYELNGEIDSALISYRMALSILESRTEAIPPSLQQSLIDLTAQIGLTQESKQYQKKFRLTVSKAYSNKQFIFAFDGVVTQMQQAKSTLWWDIDDVYLSVALPKFPRNNYVLSKSYIEAQGHEEVTYEIENIESRAREDLQARMPAITAMALARAATKYQTVKELNKKDNVLGAFANVLTIVSEVADLRHWGLLPSSIQVATTYATTGTLKLSNSYGQQTLGTPDNVSDKHEKAPAVAAIPASSQSEEDDITSVQQDSEQNSNEQLISRKLNTKSKAARKRAPSEAVLKERQSAERIPKEDIAYLNYTSNKNAVILLSSLTNKVHIANF